MSAPSDNMTACIWAWNDEESLYDFSAPGFSEATGHFTQVVWKGTKTVGCALITCKLAVFPSSSASTYGVCEYYPEGNIENPGMFAANVQAPT